MEGPRWFTFTVAGIAMGGRTTSIPIVVAGLGLGTLVAGAGCGGRAGGKLAGAGATGGGTGAALCPHDAVHRPARTIRIQNDGSAVLRMTS